ncbi:ATP-binding cassette domain-containing protein [Undibacterium arcticum]
MSESIILSADKLHKSYGQGAAKRVVVDGVSFALRRGECYGLLGPNGAGKTTTLRLCLGLAVPDGGAITLLGKAIPSKAREARQRVGVVPQGDNLDPDFTVSEKSGGVRPLFRHGRCRDPGQDSDAAGIRQFEREKKDARIGELSGGMKRRLTLARSLVNDPDLIFMDEPTTGLDPQARHMIWDRLKALLNQGKNDFPDDALHG